MPDQNSLPIPGQIPLSLAIDQLGMLKYPNEWPVKGWLNVDRNNSDLELLIGLVIEEARELLEGGLVKAASRSPKDSRIYWLPTHLWGMSEVIEAFSENRTIRVQQADGQPFVEIRPYVINKAFEKVLSEVLLEGQKMDESEQAAGPPVELPPHPETVKPGAPVTRPWDDVVFGAAAYLRTVGGVHTNTEAARAAIDWFLENGPGEAHWQYSRDQVNDNETTHFRLAENRMIERFTAWSKATD